MKTFNELKEGDWLFYLCYDIEEYELWCVSAIKSPKFELTTHYEVTGYYVSVENEEDCINFVEKHKDCIAPGDIIIPEKVYTKEQKDFIYKSCSELVEGFSTSFETIIKELYNLVDINIAQKVVDSVMNYKNNYFNIKQEFIQESIKEIRSISIPLDKKIITQDVEYLKAIVERCGYHNSLDNSTYMRKEIHCKRELDTFEDSYDSYSDKKIMDIIKIGNKYYLELN